MAQTQESTQQPTPAPQAAQPTQAVPEQTQQANLEPTTPQAAQKKSRKLLFFAIVIVVLVGAGGLAAVELSSHDTATTLTHASPAVPQPKKMVVAPTQTVSQNLDTTGSDIDQTLKQTDQDLSAYDQIDQTQDTDTVTNNL